MTVDEAGPPRWTLSDVMPAVLGALGAPSAPGLDLRPVRAAALLLVDGLGYDLLHAHAADAPFLASLADAGPLRAGFPSSTPISLTSLGTGLPVGEHGMVGVAIPPYGDGAMLDCVHWSSYGPGRRVDLRQRFPPEEIQPAETVFERAAQAGIAVSTISSQAFAGSGLTRAALRGGTFRGTYAHGDLAAELIHSLTGPGPRLSYAYHADLDTIGHRNGPGSLSWRIQLMQIDHLVEKLVERLPAGSLLAVTGDHGMVHVDRIHDADTDPALLAGVHLLGGDPRARYVYTRPGAAADVQAAWQARLGDDALVVSREQAIAEGWFGPVRPGVAERIGDLVVATRGNAAVVRSVVEPVLSRMPGQHGSLSSAEQRVPLLTAYT